MTAVSPLEVVSVALTVCRPVVPPAVRVVLFVVARNALAATVSVWKAVTPGQPVAVLGEGRAPGLGPRPRTRHPLVGHRPRWWWRSRADGAREDVPPAPVAPVSVSDVVPLAVVVSVAVTPWLTTRATAVSPPDVVRVRSNVLGPLVAGDAHRVRLRAADDGRCRYRTRERGGGRPRVRVGGGRHVRRAGAVGPAER